MKDISSQNFLINEILWRTCVRAGTDLVNSYFESPEYTDKSEYYELLSFANSLQNNLNNFIENYISSLEEESFLINIEISSELKQVLINSLRNWKMEASEEPII